MESSLLTKILLRVEDSDDDFGLRDMIATGFNGARPVVRDMLDLQQSDDEDDNIRLSDTEARLLEDHSGDQDRGEVLDPREQDTDNAE